jgi:hypothetical protein
MGAYSDNGSLGLEVFDGRDRSTNAGIIGDGLAVKWDVHITADQDALSFELSLREILDGLFSVQGNITANPKGYNVEEY